MATLTTTPVYSAIYQLEATDDVQGGAGAIANLQAQELGNRDDYLLSILNNNTMFQVLSDIVGSVYPLAADSGKLYRNNDLYPHSVYLPDISTVPVGTTYSFVTGDGTTVTGQAIFISTNIADALELPTLAAPIQFLPIYDGGVTLKKFASSPSWVVVQRWSSAKAGLVATGCIYDIGDAWLWCNGASVSAHDYPELSQAINGSFGGGGAFFNLPTIASPGYGLYPIIHV